MTKLCNTCEYIRYCARSGIEDVGCDRYKMDTTNNEEWLRSATTDGMTEIFMRFMFDAEFKARFVNGNFITEFRKWLKEIHDG